MNTISRRTFFQGAAAAVSATRVRGANDRINVGLIGIGGRGTAHLNSYVKIPDCQVAALCDVNQAARERAQARLFTATSTKAKEYKTMRELFADKDVDAVSIATPNHWHPLAAIWACQAGKDVYVEKPGSHNIYEGRKLVEAAHKYNRIVQHGVQLRSSEAVQEAVQHLRKGTSGSFYMARGLVYRWRPSIGHKPDGPTPSYLDWNLWQGPVQERKFTTRLVHYNWHWHWNYGNGDVGNQGIHETDMCMWGLGVTTFPSKITAMGGKFLFDDDKETPETLCSTYLYPEEKKMIEFEVRPWCTNEENGAGVGNIFYGSEGYLVINGYDKYAIYLGQKREPGPTRKAGG